MPEACIFGWEQSNSLAHFHEKFGLSLDYEEAKAGLHTFNVTKQCRSSLTTMEYALPIEGRGSIIII